MIRPLLLLGAVTLTLSGCATARKIAGGYTQAAERTFTVDRPGDRQPGDGVPAGTEPARGTLPGGLAGDTENARHAGPPVVPQ